MKKLSIALVLLLCIFNHKQKEGIKLEEYYTPELSLTEEMLMDMDLDMYSVLLALEFYDIKHREIVLAQAILETGWFRSELCLKDNNLFGLFNSHKMKMHSFNHWTESIKAYKKWIQYRYDEDKDDSYYHFLRRIKYAEDPDYIPKLIRIIKQNDLEKLI